MKKNDSVLVVFGDELPKGWLKLGRPSAVVGSQKIQAEVTAVGVEWVDLATYIDPGSIYEGSAFAEELSHLKLVDGRRLAKSFTYKGYELWWMNYNNLFYYFGLPYSQHKRLLSFVKDFKQIFLYHPQFSSLYTYFLQAHGCQVQTVMQPGFTMPRLLPFGVLMQMLIMFFSLPVLLVTRPKFFLFTGDKFETGRDYDFRMRFIYRELRASGVSFVECIRSLESWKTVLQRASFRKRPVFYSEAVAFAGRILNVITGGRRRGEREFSADNKNNLASTDPDAHFKFLVATHYLKNVYADIWSIRIMKFLIRAIGIKTAFFTAALDRNYHAVFGCKLNNIPTTGVLHGVASRFYNAYDFIPSYDGEKPFALDAYGVWSEWWKEYYSKYSRAYRPEQLFVSGPMRPLEKGDTAPIDASAVSNTTNTTKVLFVSEQLAVPQEVIPYLEALLEQPDIEITFTFRHGRDGFRDWLSKNRPKLLEHPRIKVATAGLKQAIAEADVAVGSHSTAVLEMLLVLKTPIFFQTKKWGDYYDLKEFDPRHTFFADTPAELLEKIKNHKTVSSATLADLQKRYFGDPYQDGSAWAIRRAMSFISVI